MRSLDAIEKKWLRKKRLRFEVGDTVEVHVLIVEGDRERIQLFNGVVLARRHQGLSETFTVRRIVQGEGVERVFPVNSPRVVKVVVRKRGKVRRAKLHFLRDRVGRATRLVERIGVKLPSEDDEEAVAEAAEAKGAEEAGKEKSAEKPAEKKPAEKKAGKKEKAAPAAEKSKK